MLGTIDSPFHSFIEKLLYPRIFRYPILSSLSIISFYFPSSVTSKNSLSGTTICDINWHIIPFIEVQWAPLINPSSIMCLVSITITPLFTWVKNYSADNALWAFLYASSYWTEIPCWLSLASWKKYFGGAGRSLETFSIN